MLFSFPDSTQELQRATGSFLFPHKAGSTELRICVCVTAVISDSVLTPCDWDVLAYTSYIYIDKSSIARSHWSYFWWTCTQEALVASLVTMTTGNHELLSADQLQYNRIFCSLFYSVILRWVRVTNLGFIITQLLKIKFDVMQDLRRTRCSSRMKKVGKRISAYGCLLKLSTRSRCKP